MASDAHLDTFFIRTCRSSSVNSKDEIVAAMNGEGDAHPPAIFSQSGTVSMMDACGCCWPDANFDIDKMVRLALQPSELFGFATARVPFDLTAEAERLGCEISPGRKNSQPAALGSPYRTPDDVMDPPDLMPVDEFVSGGRVRMHIEAAERLSKEHPDLFVTSGMAGPMLVASLLTGMENFLMGLLMCPDRCLEWVKRMTPYQCAYAEALSAASDNVFIITEGSEDTQTGGTFDTFVRPYQTRIHSSIKESFSTVHSCGETGGVLEDLASLGGTALSVETSGDPQGIFDRLSGKTVLVGGVQPVRCLLQGTPDGVRASARRYAEIGYPVIMPECGVPPMTPDENLYVLAHYRDRAGGRA